MIIFLCNLYIFLWIQYSCLGNTVFTLDPRNSAIENVVFVCVEVLWPSQPNGVMSSAVILPNHTFTGQV